MSGLFVFGVIVVGFIVYRASNLTMKSIYKERPTKPGEIGGIAGYQELNGAYQDPTNYTSNKNMIRLVRSEEGEFGCPRYIYEGNERGSNIVTYGKNYINF